MYYFVGIFICVFIGIVICNNIPKKENNKELDKIGCIFNVILSILYVPMSLYGMLSIFAADSMHMYSKSIQIIIEVMITIGITLPFVSVLSIVLSVVFRKKGKRVLSFIIQYIPLMLFFTLVITFGLIS